MPKTEETVTVPVAIEELNLVLRATAREYEARAKHDLFRRSDGIKLAKKLIRAQEEVINHLRTVRREQAEIIRTGRAMQAELLKTLEKEGGFNV